MRPLADNCRTRNYCAVNRRADSRYVTMRVIVLHDNPGWLEPIRTGLRQCGVEMEDWISDETCVDLSQPPPSNAVFYNRCSSSGHTRGRPRSLDQVGLLCTRGAERGRERERERERNLFIYDGNGISTDTVLFLHRAIGANR